jgi:hypothetical protein
MTSSNNARKSDTLPYGFVALAEPCTLPPPARTPRDLAADVDDACETDRSSAITQPAMPATSTVPPPNESRYSIINRRRRRAAP